MINRGCFQYLDRLNLSANIVKYLNSMHSMMSDSRFSTIAAHVLCDEHQGEMCTNFCSSTTCLKPLCPECIETHYDYHRDVGSKPEMESFKTLKQRCSKKIKDLLEMISREADLHGVHNQSNQLPRSYETSLKKIREVKDVVDKIIKGYFSSLEQGMRKKMSFLNSDKSQMAEKLERAETIVKELENLRKSLDSPKGFIDTVQKVLRLDSGKLANNMSESYAKVKDMRKEFEIQVSIDKSFTDVLQNLLAKSVYLGNNRESRYEGQNIKSFLKDSPSRQSLKGDFFSSESQCSRWTGSNLNKPKSSLEQERLSIHRKQFSETGSQRRKSRKRSSDSHSVVSSKSKARVINVIGLNTFKEDSKRKYLHFFQHGDKVLHLLDIGSPYQSFKATKLDINFKIPQFHKSISTPNGDLYLIGGGISETSTKSQKIFRYDFQRKTLVFCTNLKYARSSHSLCFNNRYIYIVGGILNGQVITNKCERYDIIENKVQEIESCHHAVNSLCLAAFNGRYIFKFGGIGPQQEIVHFIEKFDEKQGKWKALDPVFEGKSSDFRLLSTSAAVQVTPNEIMVMGGYDQNSEGYRQTYLFSVEGQNYVIKELNTFPLPSAEAFWSNNPIIQNKTVYALQNVSSSQQNCVENQRKVLTFDGHAWTTFDQQ